MRSKCGLTPSAAHINGVKPNQSGSISWVPLALKRKRQCCRRKTDTPLCWNVWVFIFSPARFASEPVSVFPGSGSNDADSTARRVGPEWGVLVSNKWMFQATKISPRRRSLPSAPKFITDPVLFWCQSVVPGSFLVWGGGASINALGRLPALWVSTEQSELHTERGGVEEGWRQPKVAD